MVSAALLVGLGIALRGRISLWLPITGVALLLGDLISQHVFISCRVFVTIKGKDFVVASITGPRIPFTAMEKTGPFRRAEALVEEIHAAIPREEIQAVARIVDSEHAKRQD